MAESIPTVGDVTAWWADLDSGWRAVVLGTALVGAVLSGIPIPW